MNENDFDSLMQGRPFGTEEAMQADAQLRRIVTLGVELWGRTSEDMKRQPLAPHPKIPSGTSLPDLRELLRSIEGMLAAIHDPKNAWLAPSVVAISSPVIAIGARQLTAWEARCEIVRRAIEYLETR